MVDSDAFFHQLMEQTAGASELGTVPEGERAESAFGGTSEPRSDVDDDDWDAMLNDVDDEESAEAWNEDLSSTLLFKLSQKPGQPEGFAPRAAIAATLRKRPDLVDMLGLRGISGDEVEFLLETVDATDGADLISRSQFLRVLENFRRETADAPPPVPPPGQAATLPPPPGPPTPADVFGQDEGPEKGEFPPSVPEDVGAYPAEDPGAYPAEDAYAADAGAAPPLDDAPPDEGETLDDDEALPPGLGDDEAPPPGLDGDEAPPPGLDDEALPPVDVDDAGDDDEAMPPPVGEGGAPMAADSPRPTLLRAARRGQRAVLLRGARPPPPARYPTGLRNSPKCR